MTRTSWRELYEAAVAETNPIQFSKKADLAMPAMHQRVDELPRNGSVGDEKRAIVEALRDLQRILKKNGWGGLVEDESERSGAA